MAFSVLSHLFLVERHRQRVNRSALAAGLAVPALGEIQMAPDEPSLLATNMRGSFLLTRKLPNGIVRYGFSPCPPSDEHVLVAELAAKLWELSEAASWGIRCRGVPEAVASFKEQGLEPRTLVVSSRLAQRVLGQETLPPEGVAGVSEAMQVLVTNIPENYALIALAPPTAGVCVRVGDGVGLLVRPQAFRVVLT